MGKIIVLGSINMDVVARTHHHPRAGETIFGQALNYIPGGKGSNQSVAASRLRDGVMLVGKLGEDGFGQDLKAFLAEERLDLSHLMTHPTAPTGIALIVVNDESENTIVVISGSNYEITPDDVADIAIAADDVVVAPFEVPQAATLALFQKAKAAGAMTVLNPAPAAPFIVGLAQAIDVMIVNETELAFFTQQTEIEVNQAKIAQQMRDLRVHDEQIIVVTLGGEGVMYLSGDEQGIVEGRRVAAVDTTGAGDCFTGALATALSEGRSIAEAIHFANVAASISVQTLGASASMPTRDVVDAALS